MNNKLEYYIFIEELNKTTINNLIKLKRHKSKVNIIIINKNFSTISTFARTNKIPFYIIDNIKFAIKNNAQGVFLTSKNKILRNNIKETTKLKVIGSAHNQLEYFIKKNQKCSTIMLSPIFYNHKYSPNRILNPIKFNLITLYWKCEICALGGINNKNIKLVNLTKSKSLAIKSLITK